MGRVLPVRPRAPRFGSASVALVVFASLLLNAAVPTVPSNNWASTGNMAAPRAGALSTLLYDGRVLITGGWSTSGGVLASTERYSPNGGAFLATPPMATARAGHTATLLPDGRVLVAGGIGEDGRALTSAEIYDPAANAWAAAGSLWVGRSGHTATRLLDGRILFAGGADAGVSIDSLELFDPGAGTFWFLGSTLSSPRTDHAAALLTDGRVLIVGGFDGTHVLASTDIYDPSTWSLAPAASLATARTGHSATTLLSGHVLVAGGANESGELASGEVYDPATNTFAAAGNAMLDARQGHQAILLPHNNQLLIVGGTAGGSAVASAEVFVEWQNGQGMFGPALAPAAARGWSSAAALSFPADAWTRTGPNDGLLLLTGGRTSATPASAVASSELYGFATVTTDAYDYSPGSTVTIRGAGWVPGETVILTLDEYPYHDTHTLAPVTADGSGRILSTEFSPDAGDIGVLFRLTASGSVSQAQTTFRDSKSINISFAGTGSGAVQIVDTTDPTQNTACSSPTTCSPLLGNNDVGTLTAIPDAGSAFGGWSAATSGITGCVGTTCNFSMGNGLQSVTATFVPTTTLTVTSETAIYGGSTGPISAVLTRTSNGTPVSGRTISFTLNGGAVGSAVTDASGIATLITASLMSPAKINAGTYESGIGASFAGDSSFATSSATNTLTVNQRAITVTAVTNTKTYDGTTSATGVPTMTSGTLASGDTVTWAETYDTKTVGFGDKTLIPSGTVSDGNSGLNYSVSFVNDTTGTITSSPLTIAGVTAADKVYDASTTATVNTGSAALAGVQGSDDVALTVGAATATFADPNVGTAKAVTAGGFALSGADAANYTLSQPTGLTASITARALTVTADAKTKIYGNTDPALTYAITAGELQGSDTLSGGLSRAAGETVGTYAIGGTLANANYDVTFVSADLTITPRPMTVAAKDDTKIYGDSDPELRYVIITGALQGTDTLSGGLSRAPGEAVGVYAISSTLTNSNYALTYIAGTLTIAPRGLTVTADAKTKTYGGSDPALTWSITSGALQGTDTLSGGVSRAPGEAVGTYLIGSTLANSNYSVTFVPANLTITPKALTGTITADDKPYDGTVTATAHGSLAGVVGEDAVTLVVSGAAFNNPNVGTGKPVTATLSLTGANAGNYTVNASAAATAAITAVALTASFVNPVNNATDVDMTQAMSWTSVGAEAYYLYLGTTLGAKNLVDSSELHTTSYSAVVAPGTFVYARLWTKMNGVWRYVDITFTTRAPLHFTHPADGATTADLSLPFTWGAVSNAQAYYLYVGTTQGSSNLTNSGEIQSTFYLATSLPVGQQVYARLWVKVAGVWSYVDRAITPTATVSTVAQFTAPTNGATNVDLNQNIAWTPVPDAQKYYLYVGTTLGSSNLVNSGEITSTSYLAPTLPIGQLLYARLWTKVAGVWRYTDITFTATTAAVVTATMTTPFAGETGVAPNGVIQWTSVAAAQKYYLYVGTTPGAKDLIDSEEICNGCTVSPMATSWSMSNGGKSPGMGAALPNQLVYVRLWTMVGNVWRFTDATFRMAN